MQLVNSQQLQCVFARVVAVHHANSRHMKSISEWRHQQRHVVPAASNTRNTHFASSASIASDRDSQPRGTRSAFINSIYSSRCGRRHHLVYNMICIVSTTFTLSLMVFHSQRDTEFFFSV